VKKITLLAVSIGLAISLAGCSNSNSPATTSPTSTTKGELSDVDPWLESRKFVREQVTDPVLYDYNSASGLGNTSSETRQNITTEEQAKIGKIAMFSKSSKYGISGSAEITGAGSIQIKNFAYNGSCGTISLQIAASNASNRPIATLKSVSTAISENNGNFTLEIPSNVSLIQFNQINITCSGIENPVSQATFG
jgi:hypothetical protein